MSEIHDDLMSVLDAVEIHSSRRFSVLGVERDVADGAPLDDARSADADPLAAALASELYEQLYTRRAGRPRIPASSLDDRRDFISMLSAANSGQGTWTEGWTIRRVEDAGRIFIAHGDVEFWAEESRLRVDGDATVAGASCRAFVPKERRGLLPGYYLALSDAAEREEPGISPIWRYYWHLRAETAVPFVTAATSTLNGAGLPFRLKVAGDPSDYRRADSGVLYVDRRERSRLAPLIAAIHARVASGLRPDPPLFTRRLAHGLGFAEDPANRLSFGEHRCRLIADAMLESFRQDEADRTSRASRIGAVFAREGLDASRPYLGAGSEGSETPRALDSPPDDPVAEAPQTARRSPGPDARSTLEAAAAIGREICRSAYWDVRSGQCNWIGRSGSERSAYRGQVTPIAAALGPELYSGSAGIALFLAHLFSFTRDDEVRRTALAAIRRSLRRLERMTAEERPSPISFHQGHLGVAYAAHRIASPLEARDELDGPVRLILDGILESLDHPHVLDVIGGSAGAIPALLTFSHDLADDRYRDAANTLGEELCRVADWHDGRCNWDPAVASAPGLGSRPLTGLSHGAAGIGLALFEIHAATGRREFLETARGAFAYEDSLFDPHRGNWPDLRASGTTEPGEEFALAWCHGAPGIALSRLRAARLDPERSDDHLRRARIAILTTLRAIEDQIESPRADATPCHGLSGLIEIVGTAGRLLNEPSWCDRSHEAAEILIARHAARGDWPSGAPSGGRNPSLMVGTAGIGQTFLRLHDPEQVNSVLWIEM